MNGVKLPQEAQTSEISKCRRCPQNKSSFAYQATVSSHPLTSGFIHTNQSSQPLTQEMVQQIGQSSLASIFSAMGFSSTSKPTSMWYVDYVAIHYKIILQITVAIYDLYLIVIIPILPVVDVCLFQALECLSFLKMCEMFYSRHNSLPIFYLSVTWLAIITRFPFLVMDVIHRTRKLEGRS